MANNMACKNRRQPSQLLVSEYKIRWVIGIVVSSLVCLSALIENGEWLVSMAKAWSHHR